MLDTSRVPLNTQSALEGGANHAPFKNYRTSVLRGWNFAGIAHRFELFGNKREGKPGSYDLCGGGK